MGGMQSLSGLANAKDMALGPTLTVCVSVTASGPGMLTCSMTEVILTKGLERIEKQVSLLFQGSLSSGALACSFESHFTSHIRRFIVL